MKIKLLALLPLLCLSALGQSYYVGFGPSLYTSAPYKALDLTTGVCTDSGGTCALSLFEGRGDVYLPNQLVYSLQGGLLQRLATAQTKYVSASLFTLAAVGAASVTSPITSDSASQSAIPASQLSTMTAPTQLAFTGNLGGGVSIHPNKWPNWSVSFAARAIYTDRSQMAWKPWAGVMVGYTFHQQKP